MYKIDIYNALDTLFGQNGNSSAYLVENNMPIVAFFGIWTGQDEEPESNLPLKYPAILLDFENTVWEGKGRQMQVGKATVAIRVVQQSYVSSNKNAPQSHIDKTNQLLAYSAYIDHVVRHTLVVTGSFGTFKRIADGTVVRNKSVYSELVRYEVSVNDSITVDNNFVLGRAKTFDINK